MKKYKAFFQSSQFFTFVVIAGLVYLGGNAWSSSKKSQKNIIKVTNYTQSCQISAEKHNGHIKLSLRNNSPKSVTAFVISSRTSPNDVFTFIEEFATAEGDFVIAPGEVYEKVIGMPLSLNNEKAIPLDLVAVVFDDKSSEGDKRVVQEIEDERLGEKIQFMRAIPLLNKMLALQDSEIPNYFNKDFKRDLVKALFAADGDLLDQLKKEKPQIMSDRRTDKLPEQIKQGLHSGKQYFLGKIRDLENLQKTHGESALREEIIRIKEVCERIVGRI